MKGDPCDLCKKPLGWSIVRLWEWTFHPKCAVIARERLERFAKILFDATDEEFEAWLGRGARER